MKNKKPSQDAKPTSEAVLDEAIDTLSEGLKAIRTEIRAIKDGTAAETGHDRGSRIAFLTGRVGSIADSVRKVEAAREKRLSKLTPGQVLAYLRTLDHDARAALLREANRIDQEGSMFG